MQKVIKNSPTFFEAIFPIIFLIILLSINVAVFGDASLDGSNQIVLMVASAVASLIALRLGFSWDELQIGIVNSISSALPSLIILLLVGALAGSWMLSGIVPAMIYYGIKLLNPEIFLIASCIICIIVSLATGSSWTTSATIGVALIGIGKALGISEGLIAGSILSGAYFGDKMSPLSDTTNLAPAVAGADLFSHIRYLSYTTFPSITICLVLFLFFGLNNINSFDVSNSASISNSISEKFYISPVLFLAPLFVIFLIYKKTKAIPSLFFGVVLGVIFSLIFQPDLVREVSKSGDQTWVSLFIGTMKSLYGTISISTSNDMVNDLLTSRGMFGMLSTIWLIFAAMIFGGVMETSGFLRKIVNTILNSAKSTGALVTSTAGTCIFFNLSASDQYLSIVVPGRMFSDIYKKHKLHPVNLSRTLEDSGTVTSVLIPWNTCGAYHSTVLNVSTITYFPYCFFSFISPLMTILFAYLRIKIKKLK